MGSDHRYVFISYSSRNYEAALELKELLNRNHIACWMAPESIPAGSDYATQIPRAIGACDAFLLLLTAEAQASNWVPKELDLAITRNKTVIPFQIDDAELSAPFEFRLSNVQRIMASGRYEEAVRELLHQVGGLAAVPKTGRELLLDSLMGSAMSDDRFVGREAELRRIEEELTNNRVAFLSGLGGMGKTELALRYGDSYRSAGRGQVYFVRFKKTFDQTVTDNIAPYIPGFNRDGLNERQIIDGAMQHLHRGDPNDLLILDNADDAEESVDQPRRVLRSLPMRILVTTRTESDTAIGVGKLDNNKLHDIFRSHKVDISEKEMDELIAAVGGHTLTVDLMARLLRRERQSKALQTLRDALGCRDLKNADLGTVDTVYYGNEGQARINEHLKAVFKVANLGPAEQTLLRFASLLPECGLDVDIFVNAAVQQKQEKKRGFFARLFQKPEAPPLLDTPRKVKDALQILADGGWLEWEGDILKIHPVICIVCWEVLKPTQENCHGFVRGVCGWYDRKNYDHVRFAQIAELLTNASEALGDPDGWYNHTAGYLWSVLGEFQQALKYQLRAAELLEQSQSDSNNLAITYSNVGCTYSALGDHDKALEYQLKALAIRETLLPPEHPDLATSYNNVGGTYDKLDHHTKALEYLLKALAILEKVLPSEHPDLATSYNNVGSIYGDLGDYARALEYKQKALEIREKVLPPEHPDLAQSYNNVGSTYGDLGDHAKALEYKQKALAIREKVLPPTHPNLALSCNNVAWTYYEMGNYDTALNYMRRAADIAERSLPEGHPSRVNYRRRAERFEREIGERRTSE